MANAAETEESTEESTDGPLIDSPNQAIKKMVAKAKERGYVTYDELNEVLPQNQVSSEQIEDTMAMLSEMGVNIIEGDESDDSSSDEEKSDKPPAPVATVKAEGTEYERTDDPVRMYLREMGSIELLSRQGEIEIAKRIEEGCGPRQCKISLKSIFCRGVADSNITHGTHKHLKIKKQVKYINQKKK